MSMVAKDRIQLTKSVFRGIFYTKNPRIGGKKHCLFVVLCCEVGVCGRVVALPYPYSCTLRPSKMN